MDDLLKYFYNLYYGFRFKRFKVDDALHIPEGNDKEGNLRINGTLQVKLDDEWQEVQGQNIIIDAFPTADSPNTVSSGGVAYYLETEANARNNMGSNLLSIINNETTNRIAGDASVITTLRDGVTTGGDTLQKLYNLIIGSFSEVTVADITARNAYNAKAGDHVFVTNDGDGSWALYKATTAGVNATYVKLSDPDLLNALMSASAIKTAYESNADTNAFTNALLIKLNAISGTNTGDQDISGIAVNAAAIAAEATTRASADTSEATARANGDATVLTTLRNGVAAAGDTLLKLYNLINATVVTLAAGTSTYTVPAGSMIEFFWVIESTAISFGLLDAGVQWREPVDLDAGGDVVESKRGFINQRVITFTGITSNTVIKIYKR